ncbi:hypothetical protein TNCV_1907981 [Trichonephila clavipes]|nr:hypothetical protein TNCV_1907981 [Trichonephila clavipes]
MEKLMHVKSVMTQSPHVNVVSMFEESTAPSGGPIQLKFREELPAQCHSRHLTMVQNYIASSPRYASKYDACVSEGILTRGLW